MEIASEHGIQISINGQVAERYSGNSSYNCIGHPLFFGGKSKH